MAKSTKLKNNRPVIFHFRGNEEGLVLPPCTTGVTVVYDPKSTKFGVAICSEPNFNRRLGIQIAAGRMTKARKPITTMTQVKSEALRLARTKVGNLAAFRLAKINLEIERLQQAAKGFRSCL